MSVPVDLACLMVATVVLLTAAVCAVLWRKPDDVAGPLPAQSVASEAQAAEPPAYAPLEGALWTAQLEVDQTFYVQTQTAKYRLTLRDSLLGLYDVVRTGPKKGDAVVQERFQMLFRGTFVPDEGLRYREFTPGGRLCYQQVDGSEIRGVKTSTRVVRVFFHISEGYRQAS